MTDYAAMLAALEDGSFRPARFGHEAHVGLGFQALKTHGFLRGMAVFSDGLRAAAERLGLTTKFNATVTIAFLSLIAERMAEAPDADADAFIARNPDLLSPDVLSRFYSPARLSSPLARSVFLMPDRVGS
ncbi:hypothetical protein HKCCE2091_01430 [Rhodobacterales bacterium HKCCE2091]|nr:hypothetical protein [Rhodobacterales bacterium HKCCE2091]